MFPTSFKVGGHRELRDLGRVIAPFLLYSQLNIVILI